jgi:hypothetical protein
MISSCKACLSILSSHNLILAPRIHVQSTKYIAVLFLLALRSIVINKKAKVQALIIVHVTGYGNVVIRQVTPRCRCRIAVNCTENVDGGRGDSAQQVVNDKGQAWMMMATTASKRQQWKKGS